MIESLWPFAVLILLALVGLPTSVAAITAGLAAWLAYQPASHLGSFVALGLGSMVSFAALGLALLLVLGAGLQGLGAVQTFPERPLSARMNAERDGWFGGGTLGAPLPIAVPALFVALISVTSIADVMKEALAPAIFLTLVYSGLFLALLFGGRRSALRKPEGGVNAALVVFRIITPLIALAIFYPPLMMGIATTNEMIAILLLVLFAISAICAGLSPGGWRRWFSGMLAGAGAIGRAFLLLLGLIILNQAVSLAGDNALAELIQAARLTPSILVAAFVLITLLLGIALGPIAAVGLAVIAGFGPMTSEAGFDRLHLCVTLLFCAEAIRVGPRLWADGFLRASHVLSDGTVVIEKGAWPYYIAAVICAFGYGLLVTIL